MRPATEKQLALIKDIERFTGAKFKGDTIREASEFISNNMEAYQEARMHAFEMVYNPNCY